MTKTKRRKLTDEEVWDRLIREASPRAVPFISREAIPPRTLTQSDYGLEVLWDQAYIPASKSLIEQGLPPGQVDAQMAKVKVLLGIVEQSDLITFPPSLHDKLVRTSKLRLQTSRG